MHCPPKSPIPTPSHPITPQIRLYRGLADAADASGHGTHTMATVLGFPADAGDTTAAYYQGMAPGAKLAFTDLAAPSRATGLRVGRRGADIVVPGDMGNDYYR